MRNKERKTARSEPATAQAATPVENAVIAAVHSFLRHSMVVVAFAAFCFIQTKAIDIVTKTRSGLEIFYGALVLGAVLVAIVSWAFETFYPPDEESGP